MQCGSSYVLLKFYAACEQQRAPPGRKSVGAPGPGDEVYSSQLFRGTGASYCNGGTNKGGHLRRRQTDKLATRHRDIRNAAAANPKSALSVQAVVCGRIMPVRWTKQASFNGNKLAQLQSEAIID